MTKLSDLLTSSAAVRNENAAEQNTAIRVGNVLYSLTQYLQQYTSVADISMKVSAVGVTIAAKSQTGDTTLFEKTIALPVASNEQAGILTAEAFSAFQSDISELQEDLTALYNEKDVLADRIKVNAEDIADLGFALRGKSAKSSAYYDPFISMGDIKGWPAFTDKLDGISDISELENQQKYMGRCRARVDGVTVEVYHFINSFSKNDLSQVVLGNVSANQNEQGKWQVTFTPNRFNIIYRQYKEGKWSAWQRINDHPHATPSLDGLMSADDKKALDSVDSAFKNLEGMNFSEASEYCATFDNIIERLDGGAIRFSKPTIFTFSGAGNDQGMIINLPSSTRIITQYAFTMATINGGFSRRFVQYNLSSLTITNVGEWLPISGLIPAATTSAAGLMIAADKEKSDNYPSQFVLDLGLVASQERGEQEAAKSEVAGNRNISFIRFQVQEDEKNIKTTLIMQWPDGIDTTGQIMFTDQSQFRRSVTGATGVKGNATNAYPWERTAPHLIDYDKSSRMLQLKDYLKRAVSNEGGVELPLATSTQDGLMSAEDKTKLNKTIPVKEETWTEQHHMNAYTECGEYHIHGERKNKYDGLPIINADPGHTIDATLTVLDSSLPTEGSAKTDVCVTQILRMSNRTGGDGHIFVRTGQTKTKSQLASGSSTSWGTWEKLMGVFEKNGITSVSDLDACTTNGMYSGLYANTSQASLGGINFYPGDTFLMITANGYAASPFGTPQLTQILFKFPVRKAPLPATANMYIRVAYWDTSDAKNKRWVFGNFAKMVTAQELASLETRIEALEAQLSSTAK